MLLYAERLACMPLGRLKLKDANWCLEIPEACAGALIMQQASFAGGLGARCAPSGEREGQSPLASSCSVELVSGEREGQLLVQRVAPSQWGARGAAPAHSLLQRAALFSGAPAPRRAGAARRPY
jgi:hypothetical protein